MINRISICILFIFPIIITVIGRDTFRSSEVIGPTLGFQEISQLSAVLPSNIYEPLLSLATEKRSQIIQHQEMLEKMNFGLAIMASLIVLVTAILSFLAETGRINSNAALATRHFLPIVTAAVLTAQPIFTNKIVAMDRELARVSTTVTFYVDTISMEDEPSKVAEHVELLRAFLNEV